MRIYFDTSAINKITYDQRRDELIEKLIKRYETYISLLNCAEIAANSDKNERKEILRVAEQLSRGYFPLAHPQRILRRSLKAFKSLDSTMYISISKEDFGVWEIIKNPEKADDQVKKAAEAWIKREECWYQDMHEKARPFMQNTLNGQLLESRSAFLRNFIQHEGFLKEIISAFLKETGFEKHFFGRELQVISALEPWRFYLASIGVGIYNRTLQSECFSKKKNAGSIDTQQSVYLANIDIFVTDDKQQRKMLRLIEPFGHIRRKVWSYNMLVKSL
jgi:hypothetical protein